MIPYYDLNAIQSEYLQEITDAASSVISSGNYISLTNSFEPAFAEYVGARYCIGTNSGTSSLQLALAALGIGRGDEVITVSHTYKATAAAIIHAGATPVYVDIDDTFTMDASKIEQAITKNTKCILPVHLYGNVAPMKEIMRIAKKHKLFVIEDCAQAHGSRLNGQHVGTFGDVGCFSFYPGKGLGACGDAGSVVCNDEALYSKMFLMHSFGEGEIGFNFRMDVMQAEILRVKLKHFPEILKKKQEIAGEYNKYFHDVSVREGAEHSYHIYPILIDNREKFIEEHKDKLELRMHYETPVHKTKKYQQPCYLPVTEQVSSRQVSVPIYPGVDYKKIIEIL